MWGSSSNNIARENSDSRSQGHRHTHTATTIGLSLDLTAAKAAAVVCVDMRKRRRRCCWPQQQQQCCRCPRLVFILRPLCATATAAAQPDSSTEHECGTKSSGNWAAGSQLSLCCTHWLYGVHTTGLQRKCTGIPTHTRVCVCLAPRDAVSIHRLALITLCST